MKPYFRCFLPEVLGRFSLYLFAFSAWLSTTVSEIALLGTLAAALVRPSSFFRWLMSTRLLLLVCTFIGYVTLAAFRGALLFPETQGLQWAYTVKWAWFLFMLPCAFWINNDEKRAFWIMTLAFFGFILAIVTRSDWQLFPVWFAGERYCFGFPCLTISLLSGVFILEHVIMAGRLVEAIQYLFRKYGIVAGTMAGLIWALSFVVITQVLITSQSRGVWLFLVIIVPCIAPTLFTTRATNQRGALREQRWLGATLLVISLAVLLVGSEAKTIKKRIFQEKGEISSVLHGNWKSLAFETSIGIRAHVWSYGVRAWLRSPIVGWGPGTNVLADPFWGSRAGFATDEERDKLPLYATHLHSDLLESLVRLGLIGTSILGAIVVAVISRLKRAKTNRGLATDTFLFLSSSFLLMFMFGLIEFRFVHVMYRHLVIIICSISLGISPVEVRGNSSSTRAPWHGDRPLWHF